jgi:hypothetical protein
MARRHRIGLLLAPEEDWPASFESVVRRLGPIRFGGETHEFPTDRIRNEPFDLRYVPDYALVIDRLSWWYDFPREWLKKIALMDNVYLLNNPFTFQAMEKHAAYCAMIRLGLHVPETWLIPHRVPPDNPRYDPMAERYNPPIDLDEIGEHVGFPLFMKPFDGGMWVGVTRVTTPEELRFAYEHSGERLMHVQAAVDGYDVFARSLSIGPQTKVMRYDPNADGHYRYLLDRDFLPAGVEREVAAISRLVNAFFRWEANSCEVLVKDTRAHPIDYANASPDLALVSLHYYFPWAIRALVAWCIFCCVTGRRMRINQNTRDYFQIGDDVELSYEEKLERYAALADAYFQTREFQEFYADALPHLDEVVVDYVDGREFDDLIVKTITTDVFEPEKHEALIERSRTNVSAWVVDQRAASSSVGGSR